MTTLEIVAFSAWLAGVLVLSYLVYQGRRYDLARKNRRSKK